MEEWGSGLVDDLMPVSSSNKVFNVEISRLE